MKKKPTRLIGCVLGAMRACCMSCLAHALCACGGPTHGAGPSPIASATTIPARSDAAQASTIGVSTGKAASAGSAAPVVARPPVLWEGSEVSWEELRPLLAERAGASVLEEVLLERQLDRMLLAEKKTVNRDLLEAEEREALASMSDDPQRAMVLLLELRAAQGLGEKRWKSLLKRNASLRLLVQNDVKVTPEAVEAVVDAAHGARRQCRVMALPNLEECAKARARLEAGEPFGEVAADLSTDRSASRGGIVLPVSRLDPSWPSSFRQTLWSLPKGIVSSPVLIDHGYVFILYEQEIPGDPGKALAARAGAERAVRRGQERILMENLSKQLRLAHRNATIFDDSILDGWNRVKNASR